MPANLQNVLCIFGDMSELYMTKSRSAEEGFE
jgi:hypothetical protein